MDSKEEDYLPYTYTQYERADKVLLIIFRDSSTVGSILVEPKLVKLWDELIEVLNNKLK